MSINSSERLSGRVAPRVVFLMRSVSHFTYHESTFDGLLGQGARIQFLFDPVWSKNRSTEYVEKWIERHGLPPFKWCVSEKGEWMSGLRELASYASYLRRPEQSEFYLKRWEGYLPDAWKNALKSTWGGPLKELLKFASATGFFRLVEGGIPPRRNVVEFLASLKPDVLVLSPLNMRFSGEVEYVKAAKKLGIPSALAVYSWDNLTTKGLIHFAPDRVMAWNESHREEAARIHGVPDARIEVTGSPFFDKWFSRPVLTEQDRAEFCRKVGLDPARPFITYLGSSGNIAKDETWLIAQLARALRESADPFLSSLQIMARPHPSNFEHYSKLQESNVVTWPRPPFAFAMGVPEGEEALKEFDIAMRLPLATIGINTSAMLEAAIADRPVLAYFAKEYSATQTQAVHFQQLVGADVIGRVNSLPEFLSTLGRIRDGVDEKAAQRRAFVAEFVRPRGLGVPAGVHQARIVVGLAKQRSLAPQPHLSLEETREETSHV